MTKERINMKYLLPLITLCLGLVVGYFGKELLTSESKQLAPIVSGSIKSIRTSYETAREMSLAYRTHKDVGYCNFIPLSNRKIILLASQVGFMRLSYENIADLKSAVDDIRQLQNQATSFESNEFRLIYGMDSHNVVTLLVAPLDAHGREIRSVGTQHVIHRLEYGIDCPIQCDLDFARSEIITGHYLDSFPNKASYDGSCK